MSRASSPRRLLATLIIASGLFSALFINDTICLVFTPIVLVAKALILFACALAGWLAGYPLPLVAVAAGAIMMLIAGRDATEAFARVEWSLLVFFASLFVVIRGVSDLPLFADLTTRAISGLNGAPSHDVAMVSGAMVALSNLVSNSCAQVCLSPCSRWCGGR